MSLSRGDILRRFEEARAGGNQPRIEDYLDGVKPAHRLALLNALVYAELAMRLARKETVSIEEYLDRFPEITENAEMAVDLIVAEVRLRRRQDENLSLEDYRMRFPKYFDKVQSTLDKTVASSIDQAEDQTDPLAPPALTKRLSEDIPEKAGRYLIEEEIARGGMGIVLRARDPDMERTLAVKFIRRKSHKQDEEAQKRFLKEAKITGQLQHPGIPPIHDLGKLDDGRPFFALKLIKGQTLADILKQRDLETKARESGENGSDAAYPPPDPRFIHLFEQICQTIAYAHSRGVIHRDLKPENIMVGAFGEVQVMDWGLAKVLSQLSEEDEGAAEESGTIQSLHSGDAEFSTKTGDTKGTPAYMAPEQARGEIRQLDERCDVFGLGGILCRILTGKPTFPGARVRDRLRQAFDGDLSDAFARLDNSRAEAELIALAKKCLAPKKTERPRHAGEAAEAVETCLTRVQERLRQAELDKAQAEVQAEEERKRRRVEEARTEEERKRRRAEHARAEEERRRRWLTMALAAALVLLFAGAGAGALWFQQDRAARFAAEAKRLAEREKQKADQERRQATTRQGVSIALNQARKIRGDLLKTLKSPGGVFTLLDDPSQWRGRIESAKAALERARVLQARIQNKESTKFYEQIQDLERQLKSDNADRKLAQGLEKIRMEKAGLVQGRMTFDRAREKYPKLFAQAGLSVAPGKQSASVIKIRNSAIKEQLLAALDDWAFSAWLNKENELAGRILSVARRVQPDSLLDKIRDPDIWQKTQASQKLADSASKNEAAFARLSPQMLHLMGMLLFFQRNDAESWLTKAQGLHPDDFWLNFMLGNVVNDAKPLEAAGFFRAALAIRPKASVAHNNLGIIYFDRNEFTKAMAAYKKALEFDPNDAKAHNNYGTVLLAQNDVKGAVAAFHKAIACDPKLAHAYTNLCTALQEQNKEKDALKAVRKAIEIDPQLGKAHHVLGNMLYAQGDHSGAVREFEEAVKLDPRHAMAWCNLGIALLSQGKIKEAHAKLSHALAVNPRLPEGYLNLGKLFEVQGDEASALAAYQKAAELAPKLAMAHNNVAAALHALGDKEGCIQAARKALSLNPKLALAYCNLGKALRDSGDFVNGLKALRRGHELGSLQPGWPFDTKRWIEHCERLLGLDKHLDAVLAGTEQAKDATDNIVLAELSVRFKKRNLDAVRFYSDAFKANSKLAENVKNAYRYNAACAAAKAASGLGIGADKLSDEKRAALRKKAREFLEANLGVWNKLLDDDDYNAVYIMDGVGHWYYDPDLGGIRDLRSLAKLSTDELITWRKMWDKVDKLVKEARNTGLEAKFNETLTKQQTERIHTLKVKAGKRYVVSMDSRQLDPVLRLKDANGKIIAENDDIYPEGRNRNARIDFTPEKDGIYRIIATSYQQRGIGNFTLTIQRFSKD